MKTSAKRALSLSFADCCIGNEEKLNPAFILSRKERGGIRNFGSKLFIAIFCTRKG